MLRALGCDHETPDSSETAALAALAEVIALHSNGCDFTLGEIFTLSNNVMMHRDYVVGPNGFAIYDLRSLQESVLDPMATLAIRLCGGFYSQKNNDWRDGHGDAKLVTFGGEFA